MLDWHGLQLDHRLERGSKCRNHYPWDRRDFSSDCPHVVADCERIYEEYLIAVRISSSSTNMGNLIYKCRKDAACRFQEDKI